MNFEETGDMDAETAQAYAAGDMSDAESFSPTASSDPLSRLFDGRASGPSVGQLEGDYGLQKDQAIFGRGLIRTATGDGVPPIAEILGGAVMWALRTQTDSEPDMGVSRTVDAIEGETDRVGEEP